MENLHFIANTRMGKSFYLASKKALFNHLGIIFNLPFQVPRDGSVQNRAERTIPWPLYIAKSKIEDGGLGVWTSANLPEGLVFGPCEGRVVKRTGEMSGYAWEVNT